MSRSRAPTDDEFDAFLAAACVFHSKILTRWIQRCGREVEPDEVTFRAIGEVAWAINVDNVKAREAFMDFRDEIFEINEDIKRVEYVKRLKEKEARRRE
jgi:hypothetical protein